MNRFPSVDASLNCPAKLVTPASAHPTLDAQTQQFLDLQAESGIHPDGLLLLPAETGMPAQTAARFAVSTQDLTFEAGEMGTVRIRIVRPCGSDVSPAVLYFPGGGWRTGDCATHDLVIRRLAVESDVAVVFVEYTHAPEARFPTQTEQAYAALEYVVRRASALKLNGDAIAVAGEGAGGNIAAAVCLLAKTRRGPKIALQILFCPILSALARSRSFVEYADGPGVSAAAMQASIHAAFPADCLHEKFAMPLHARTADLEDLPPALIVTAENDVVRDDGEAYARQLMRAGVQVSAIRCLGTIHDFVVLEGLAHTPPTDAALRHASCAIRDAFEGSRHRG